MMPVLRQHRQPFYRAFLFVRARPAFQMIFKFLAELFHEGDGRHRCRIAERTESPAEHVLRQVPHVVDILLQSAAGMKTLERLFEPVRSFAARDAPTAAFMSIKL